MLYYLSLSSMLFRLYIIFFFFFVIGNKNTSFRMTRSEQILLLTTELSDIKELGGSRPVRHSGIKFAIVAKDEQNGKISQTDNRYPRIA